MAGKIIVGRRAGSDTNINFPRTSESAGPDFLPDLQREILDVVKKYVAVRDDQVSIRVDREGDASVLELNVTLPEN